MRRRGGLIAVVGLSGMLVGAETAPVDEPSRCRNQVDRQFLRVSPSEREAAEELLGTEPWRLLKEAEVGRFSSAIGKQWKHAVLAKAASGSPTERLSATICDSTLIVRNLDLCPDAKSSSLYLLVEVEVFPTLYVFAWKAVGKGSCQ
jgi:hypothetical protein